MTRCDSYTLLVACIASEQKHKSCSRKVPFFTLRTLLAKSFKNEQFSKHSCAKSVSGKMLLSEKKLSGDSFKKSLIPRKGTTAI